MDEWTILSHFTFIFLEASARRMMPIITFSIMTTISFFEVKHGRRSSFSRWTVPCLSGVLPFDFLCPSLSLSGHVHKNMFPLSSTSLLTSKIDSHCPSLQLLSKSMLLSLERSSFQKSTCSLVASRLLFRNNVLLI